MNGDSRTSGAHACNHVAVERMCGKRLLVACCVLWPVVVAEAGDIPVCGPGAGSCFAPHDDPGCDIEECCLIVCETVDSFCCEFMWDITCVSFAEDVCDAEATCPGLGDCHQANGSPGCSDDDCCVDVCTELPTCCQFEWTAECAELALTECPCGAPGTEECSVPDAERGCSNKQCCLDMCNIDFFCCFAGWEQICVTEAEQFCGAPACDLVCPDGALTEDEPCGQNINGGCNADDPAFTPISCGETYCGTVFASNTRDTDWYELTVNEPTRLNWTVGSEFPAAVIIIAGQCDTHFGATAQVFTSECAPATASACVEPGTYYLFVSSAIEQRTLRAGAPCPSCAEDLDGDGLVNVPDLIILLESWGQCEGCPADFDGDGLVNVPDLIVLLGAWGRCDQPPEAQWGNDYVATVTCEPCEE